MTENHPPRDAQEALGGLGIVKALALSEVPGFGLKIAPLLKKTLSKTLPQLSASRSRPQVNSSQRKKTNEEALVLLQHKLFAQVQHDTHA